MHEQKTSALFLPEDTFRIQAVFSDETKQYRFPAEPLSTDEVEIRLRVGKDTFTALFLCTDEREYLMDLTEEDDIFAYYKNNI